LHLGVVADLITKSAAVRVEYRLAAAGERRGGARASIAPQPPSPTGASATTPAQEKAPKKARLTPWQEKELAELEGKIADREEAIGALDARLASGDLYAPGADPAEPKRIQAERDEAQAALDEAYARWEELEELRG
ncbi:MAG: ABC transporter C-terminal domain-containing protein, partial [Planctomycetota bacterium]